jgi:predicted RNA methylase
MKINHTDSYQDFGEQFLDDSKINGYHGSKELLCEIIKPFDLSKVKGKVVMEVGCGSGRILKNILDYEPKRVVAIEPSAAIGVARENNINAIEK